MSIDRVKRFAGEYDEAIKNPNLATGDQRIDDLLEIAFPALVADFVALNAKSEAAHRILASGAWAASATGNEVLELDLIDAAHTIVAGISSLYTRHDPLLDRTHALEKELAAAQERADALSVELERRKTRK